MALDKKNLAVGLMAGVVIGGATLGTIGVSAQEGEASLADRIANRFSISSEEVQTEIDGFREERKAERQEARAEARAEHLAGLVESGTLTQAQADELTAMKDEMKAEIEALKEAGEVDRDAIKELKEEAKAELEAWAEAEGLDLEDLKPERDGEGRKGFRGFGGFGGPDADDTSEEAPAEDA